MKILSYLTFLIFTLALFNPFASLARILNVGNNQTYSNLAAAARDAIPGDTIIIHKGTYPGGNYINNLKGTMDKWIVIINSGDVLFDGGNEAIHLTNVEYIKIKGLKFRNQTANGVNIDDGGDYSTPSQFIIIEDCQWLSMNASGNNDELKLSGVDNFTIRNCKFSFGAGGGSLIDMVGCHNGIIEDCIFEFAGSNAVQAKGGSKDIIIRRNLFRDCGLRAVNIGGSTGSQYFRPLDATFEASDILIHSNIFIGSQAPIAFVGVINSLVAHNTIILPEKWAIRILQENTSGNMTKCSNNSFINNIVYIDNRAANPTINIGPNTLPETFIFRNNLWYNSQNPNWNAPNLPTNEQNGIYRNNPLFQNFDAENFELQNNSPAIAAGYSLDLRLTDKSGNLFNKPPSIGAFEANPASFIKEINQQKYIFKFNINNNTIIIDFFEPIANVNTKIIDIQGKQIYSETYQNINTALIILNRKIKPGLYIIILQGNEFLESIPFIIID